MKSDRCLGAGTLVVAVAVVAACGGNAKPAATPPSKTAPSLIASASSSSPPPATATPPRIVGFAPASADVELAWEEKMRAEPSPDRMREAMRRLSAHPHHLGSPYDRENAQWILAQFQAAGLDAHIEQFDVLFPTPKRRVVELVSPTRFVAKLEEPAVPGDPTSSQQKEQLPTFNAYSIDGDVTAPLVYVNYGVPADYEALERHGVSVKGAIAIARYGRTWRGTKPKVAAEHGAVGCIIYSDPRDDGYALEDVYPAGPMRNADGVQRGSVIDFPATQPGDPLTPGVGATPEAKRIALADATSLTKIPVLPISYGDATPLLAALGGPVMPPDMRGGLPITYRGGPGPARVHLVVQSSWDTVPLYDVIGRLPGATAAAEWIVRGNHHDAWVNGAWDPLSGQTAMLEEVRAFGVLVSQGFRPKRTVVFAAWDGEEEGFLGSTEWAEAHEAELREHAVAYLNSDTNERGVLYAGGSHSLEKLVNGVAKDVVDPETHLSVWTRAELQSIADAESETERTELRQRKDLRLDTVGAGTDYTAFVDHLGVASLNLGFGGEDPAGVYHSVYDDFAWFTRFCDTDFVYGRALAETAGTLVMRLADADVLPFDLGSVADQAAKYVKDLEALLEKRKKDALERNLELDEGVFVATLDPRHVTVPPPRAAAPPPLDLATLKGAVAGLAKSARRNEDAIAALLPRAAAPELAALVASVNHRLLETERRLTSDEGLPRRPWYRHLLYAPGVYTGYAALPLPGVGEAVEEKRWDEARDEVLRVAAALVSEATLLDAASAEIESALRGRPVVQSRDTAR